MRKRTLVGVLSAGIICLGLAANGSQSPPHNELITTKNSTTSHAAVESATTSAPATKAKPVCDGTTVTTNCTVDGVSYATYVYHAAVPEKSHQVTTTTYDKKTTGYCTLCNDGTYSPSCATGRGACSWHGGVAQWNAPVYSSVPVTSTNTVVDAPAQAAYYDKVAN